MRYRPDIDGLRALAIVPVLLYHLDVGMVGGGFVGVDVFFVISGFLITSIIAKNLDANDFSLADFYRRRALRILPPLFFLMAATVVAGYFLLLPHELSELGGTILSATLFASNIDLWQSVDYFNPISDTNPLLHTWSLGVEEQFYIFVPLLLMALHAKFWGSRLVVFVVAVAGSLVLSIVAVSRDPTGTFYLLPTRFWEMAVGSVLALVGSRAIVRGRSAEIVALLGLSAVVAPILLLDSGSTFPAHGALSPVLGTAALLASGQSSWVGRVFSTKLPVAIGKISYSLYLWHWPLIVFYKLKTGPELDIGEIAGLSLVSVICAVISYFIVEKPFRHLPNSVSTPIVLVLASSAMAAAVGGALFLERSASDLRDVPDDVAALSNFVNYEETQVYREQFRSDQCFITSRTIGAYSAYDQGSCLGSVDDILLLGDSHGAHLAGPLESALRRSDPTVERLGQATASGCKPFRGATGEDRCTDLMSFIYEEWIPATMPRRVIIAGRWQNADIEPLRASIEYLRSNGAESIVVLGPTVEYFGDVPSLLARDELAGTEAIDEFRDGTRALVDMELRRRLAEDDVEYVSIHDLVCPDGQCVVAIGDIPVQFDYGHFTEAGASAVADAIAAQLGG